VYVNDKPRPRNPMFAPPLLASLFCRRCPCFSSMLRAMEKQPTPPSKKKAQTGAQRSARSYKNKKHPPDSKPKLGRPPKGAKALSINERKSNSRARASLKKEAAVMNDEEPPSPMVTPRAAASPLRSQLSVPSPAPSPAKIEAMTLMRARSSSLAAVAIEQIRGVHTDLAVNLAGSAGAQIKSILDREELKEMAVLAMYDGELPIIPEESVAPAVELFPAG
jgi:hypothetical protein